MAKFKIKGKKVIGTKKKDKIVSTGKGIWKKAFTVNAGKGNDIINFSKSKKKNVLNGQDGDDKIYGGKKNDKITGGKGNDVIYTGKGTNTVIINKGDGNDTIYHQGTRTDIKVNKALASDKQSFEKKGNDLLLTYTHGGTTVKEVLTFKDYYKGNKNIFLNNQKIDNFINSKGLKITGSGNIQGTNGNDTITGSNGADKIYGNGGNDVINSGNGNDSIYAGAGNDVINAGKGNNTIYIGKNEGNDTIQLGGGTDTLVFSDETKFENLSFAYDGNNLNITSNGTNVVLENYKNSGNNTKKVKIGNSTYDISNVIIDDLTNTTINGSSGDDLIIAKVRTDNQTQEIKPGSGNDTIYGSSSTNVYNFENETGNKTVHTSDIGGNDIVWMYMGQGNDTIYAPETNEMDIYLRQNIGNLGDNTIYYRGGAITLLCDDTENAGLSYYDFSFLKNQGTDDLIFQYDNTSITIKDYYLYNESNPNDFSIQYNVPGGSPIKSNIEEIIANSVGVKTLVDGLNSNEIINLDSGNTTINVDMSMMVDGAPFTYGYVENFKKTIYMQNDTVLTINIDDEVYSNGGVFCRGSGLDNDLYISIDGGRGWCFRIKDYFDENKNPKTDSVILNIQDTSYTVPEWANGSYWGRTFEMQPFGPYNDIIYGTNMAYEEIRTAYGTHDDIIYGGNGNTEIIYPYGGHNEIHAGEGTKTISLWGAQSNNDIYLGSNATTQTIIYMGGVQNNLSNTDADGNLNVTWNIQQSDTSEESYTCTATIHDWNTRTSQAKISMNGDNRNNTITAIDGVANILDGGSSGDDTLIGGTGADRFKFDYSNGYGIDEIRNATSADNIAFEFNGNYGVVDFSTFKYYTNDNGNGLVINTQTPSGANNYVIIKDYFTSTDKIDTITAINDPYGSTAIAEFSLSTVDLTNLDNFEIANGSNISGGNGIDVLIGNTGENILEGGTGDDSLHSKGGTNTFVFNTGDGSDILYQEGGASILWFKDATIADLSSVTGYDKQGYNLLIHYDGTNTLTVKDYYDSSKNKISYVKDSAGTQYKASDYFKNVVYVTGTQGKGTTKDDEIRVQGTSTTSIYGGKGSDRIWGGNNAETIFSYTQNYACDTTPGVVDEIHGGGGNDVIYAWSETNIVDGGADNDLVFVNTSQTSIISDSSGNDTISINPLDDTSDEANYQNLHFVFNVTAGGKVDTNGLRILTTDDFNLWKANVNDTNIKDISIVADADGNGWDCIETIIDYNNYALNISTIQTIKSDIAGWLTNKGYTAVADVFANEKTEGDITTLIGKFDTANNSSNWTLTT